MFKSQSAEGTVIERSGARLIVGTGIMGTGRTTGIGMMTVAYGFGNGSGFPTGNKVSSLTQTVR
jgi:hypothetical protein